MKIDQLLDKYLKGEASSAEQKLVEDWLDSSASDPAVWDGLAPSAQELWLQKVYHRIENTIEAKAPKVVKLKPSPWRSWAIAWAAAIAGLVLLFLLWPKPKTMDTTDWASASAPANAKHYVVLSDGSSIWLNAGASIRYNVAPSHKNREIYLSGEAYFDVQHNKQRPFMVHTGKITTTVLGTAFNISANKQGNQVKVVVTRGKVQVANQGEVLGMLTPNQQLVYQERTENHVQSQVNAMEAIDWLPNDLYFDNATFGEAASALEKQYNIQVKFSNEKLKNCRFTGTIKKDKTLGQAMSVICEFNGARYKIKNNIVTVFGDGCEKTN